MQRLAFRDLEIAVGAAGVVDQSVAKGQGQTGQRRPKHHGSSERVLGSLKNDDGVEKCDKAEWCSGVGRVGCKDLPPALPLRLGSGARRENGCSLWMDRQKGIPLGDDP